MRKVTINRIRAIAGCAGKVSIYTSNKLVEGEKITKDKCEFIGKIKNGSSLEFEINEEEIIVIVAYDNMNVFMPTDYILIPQGNDNVELTGKVKSNPSKGNPFIFLN